jgi:hypothetical protein
MHGANFIESILFLHKQGKLFQPKRTFKIKAVSNGNEGFNICYSVLFDSDRKLHKGS